MRYIYRFKKVFIFYEMYNFASLITIFTSFERVYNGNLLEYARVKLTAD